MFVMFLRAETAGPLPPPEDEEGDGGGGNDRIAGAAQTSPTGGVPLPDAEPSQIRLRSHGDRSALAPRAAHAGIRRARAARRPVRR